MKDTVKKEANKTGKKNNVFKTLKAEFKKIVWPDKHTVRKETTAAVVVSIVLGLVIALIDLVFKTGINLIIH